MVEMLVDLMAEYLVYYWVVSMVEMLVDLMVEHLAYLMVEY